MVERPSTIFYDSDRKLMHISDPIFIPSENLEDLKTSEATKFEPLLDYFVIYVYWDYRLYKWIYSTRSKKNARKARWGVKNSLYSTFVRCLVEDDMTIGCLENLMNKTRVYRFYVLHPRTARIKILRKQKLISKQKGILWYKEYHVGSSLPTLEKTDHLLFPDPIVCATLEEAQDYVGSKGALVYQEGKPTMSVIDKDIQEALQARSYFCYPDDAVLFHIGNVDFESARKVSTHWKTSKYLDEENVRRKLVEFYREFVLFSHQRELQWKSIYEDCIAELYMNEGDMSFRSMIKLLCSKNYKNLVRFILKE